MGLHARVLFSPSASSVILCVRACTCVCDIQLNTVCLVMISVLCGRHTYVMSHMEKWIVIFLLPSSLPPSHSFFLPLSLPSSLPLLLPPSLILLPSLPPSSLLPSLPPSLSSFGKYVDHPRYVGFKASHFPEILCN